MIRLAAVSLAILLAGTAAAQADPGNGGGRWGDRGGEARGGGEGRRDGGQRNGGGQSQDGGQQSFRQRDGGQSSSGGNAPSVQAQRSEWQARRNGGQQQSFGQGDSGQARRADTGAPTVQAQRSEWQARRNGGQQQDVRQRDNVQAPSSGVGPVTRSAEGPGGGQRWRGGDNQDGQRGRDFGNNNTGGERFRRPEGGARPPVVAGNGDPRNGQWNGDGNRRGGSNDGAGFAPRGGGGRGDYNLEGGNDGRNRNSGANGQDWRGGDNRRGDDNRWTDRGRDNANFNQGGDRRYNSYDGRHGRPGEGRALRDRDRGRSWYSPQYFQQQYRAVHRYRAAPYRYPSGWFVRTWYYGDYLPGGWYSSHYYLDWRAYGLGYPPIGCEWVRVGRDALLVDVWTGEVLSVYYDLFW